jgi:hypothetical protein
MIFRGSRYQKTGARTLSRPGGASVAFLNLPLPAPAVVQGFFPRRNVGQRLDLIANFFLKDATAFWQLCDANNAMVPDALAARDMIGIPLSGQ